MVRIAQIAVLAFASFSLAAPAEDPSSTAVEASVEDVGGSFASLDALAELGLSGGDGDGDSNIADVGGSSTKKGLRLITTKKGSRKNQTLTTVGRELGKEKELKLLKEFLKNLEKNLEKGVIGGGPVPSPSSPPKSSTSSASKPPTATTSKPAATSSGAATSKPAVSSTTGAPKASSSTPPSASSGAPKATSSATTGTAKVITTSIIPTPSPKPASELDAAVEGKEPEAPKETEGEAVIKETEGKEGEHESA